MLLSKGSCRLTSTCIGTRSCAAILDYNSRSSAAFLIGEPAFHWLLQHKLSGTPRAIRWFKSIPATSVSCTCPRQRPRAKHPCALLFCKFNECLCRIQERPFFECQQHRSRFPWTELRFRPFPFE